MSRNLLRKEIIFSLFFSFLAKKEPEKHENEEKATRYQTDGGWAASQQSMEGQEETWTAGNTEPYTLRKADQLNEQELGYTLNMMYTLYYEMGDSEFPSLSFPEQSAPEQTT